jgi:hypothetical protein
MTSQTKTSDPAVGMPVLWARMQDMPDGLRRTALTRIVETYGMGIMHVTTVEKLSPEGGFRVTLRHGREILREPWEEDDGVEPHGWEGPIFLVNWCYLRPME